MNPPKHLLLSSLLSLFLLGPGALKAQVSIDTGAYLRLENGVTLVLTGDLSNLGNLISDSTSTLEIAGSLLQVVSGNGSIQVGRLVQSNPQGLSLMTALEVTKELALDSGYVLLNQSDLHLKGNAFLSGHSQPGHTLVTNGSGLFFLHHNGGDTLMYPLSSAPGAAGHAPAWVINQGGAEDIGLRVYEGAYDLYDAAGEPASAVNNNGRVHKTWVIHEANSGGNPVKVILQFDASQEGPGFDRSMSGIDYYQAGWQQAPNPGAAAGPGPFTQERSLNSPLQQLPLVISSNQSNLPVEFLDFTVQREGAVAVLTWLTLSETHNAYFAVEMSLDGQIFQEIGQLSGQGSSDLPQSYRFEDSDLNHYPSGRIYYRLRQVDLNGSFAFSQVRSLMLSEDQSLAFSLYPNPTSNHVFLETSAREATYLHFRLYDATGRSLQAFRRDISAGTHREQVDLSLLAEGLYYLQVYNQELSHTFRILKH